MLTSHTSTQEDRLISSTLTCVCVMVTSCWAQLSQLRRPWWHTGDLTAECSSLGISTVMMAGRTANQFCKFSKIRRIETTFIILCRYFKGELNNSPIPFDDTFRSYAGPSADGTTFPGKPGKIDYVMVDKGKQN